MRKRSLRMHRFALAITGSVSAGSLLMPPAMAQESGSVVKEGTDKTKAQAERIQVTGSRIKRTETEGVSPVIKIDREVIEKSGSSSVSEVLQNMTVSIDGSYSSNSVNDSRGNVTNVNLRGLGPENTLVLLDGRRMPDEGGLGVVDLSTIPLAAVERIEVLKDSASALYGSDATGGVVNIITKKDYDGNSVYYRGSTPKGDGGDATQFSVVNGTVGNNFRVLTALNYKKNEPVFHRDRDWTKAGVSSFSIPANVALTTKTLNVDGIEETATKLYAHPNCPSDNTRLPNGLCSYNFANTMAFSPETTEVGIISNIEYNFSDRLQGFASLRAQQNENFWNMAPNAGFFDIPYATLISNKSLALDELGGTLAEGKGATVRYRSLPWGLRTWEETNQAYGGVVGLKGDLASGWEWNFSTGRSESRKKSTNPSGFFYKSAVRNGVSNGSFNPFETNLADPALQQFVQDTKYVPFVNNSTYMNTYDLNTSGELFDMPGGKAGLAIGVSRSEQFYGKEVDQVTESDDVFGVVEDQSSTGRRQINALYTELSMPVLSSLELQLAARHDQYSDFGATTNPKFGFKYMPIRQLLVRGNVGTGFKAPTLFQINNRGLILLENLYDTSNPNADIRAERQDEVEIETYGNKALKEETSLGYNGGIVFSPIDGLNLTSDYWYIKINDVIRPVDAQRVLDAKARGEEVAGVDIKYINDDSNGYLQRIRLPVDNLGEKEDSGYDLSGDYRINTTAAGSYSIASEYSRKIYSRVVEYPGGPQTNVLGQRGRPTWRMTNTLGWGIGGHGVTLRNNIISKMRKTENRENPSVNGDMGSYTTYDAQYAWNHPWNGTITVGALNVFEAKFPLDDTERVGDDQRVKELYTADGRLLYLNVTQNF